MCVYAYIYIYIIYTLSFACIKLVIRIGNNSNITSTTTVITTNHKQQ